jgi:hypothetical protein
MKILIMEKTEANANIRVPIVTLDTVHQRKSSKTTFKRKEVHTEKLKALKLLYTQDRRRIGVLVKQENWLLFLVS